MTIAEYSRLFCITYLVCGALWNYFARINFAESLATIKPQMARLGEPLTKPRIFFLLIVYLFLGFAFWPYYLICKILPMSSKRWFG